MKKLVILFLILVVMFFAIKPGEEGGGTKPIQKEEEISKNIKTTILSFGCFWCSQHDTEQIPGVIEAIPGYSGGYLKNPTYTNHQGHIEVVKVKYDSSKLTYRDLVSKIFRRQDPTDKGGAFCDRGFAYRNSFFYSSDKEKKIIEEEVKKVEDILGEDIHTLIRPTKFFTKAEEYHQSYAKKNPIRYGFYRFNCGRDRRLYMVWGDK